MSFPNAVVPVDAEADAAAGAVFTNVAVADGIKLELAELLFARDVAILDTISVLVIKLNSIDDLGCDVDVV